VAAAAPSILAITISLTKPMTRESNVIELTTAPDLNKLLLLNPQILQLITTVDDEIPVSVGAA
jgi:hypothetical protein